MSDAGQGGGVTPPTAGGAEAAPETAGRRLSVAVYAFEHSLVVTLLLMMVATYILTVLWNNAHLPYDQFDQLILKIAGYATPEEAPEDALSFLTGVVSPIALFLILMLLSYLAVRTREQSTARLLTERDGDDDGAAPTGGALGPLSRLIGRVRSVFVRRLVWAFLVTGFMWGFVQLVSELRADWLCVVAVLLLAVGLFWNTLKKGVGDVRRQGLVGVAAGVLLGVGLTFALSGELTGWIGLGMVMAGGLAIIIGQPDLVAGAAAGLGLALGFDGFLAAQIPGFIAMALAFSILVGFLGPTLASLTGGLLGGSLLLWYFAEKAGDQYDWTSGLTAILLLYVGFIGASMATHDGRHITVDAVRKTLKSKVFHLYNAIGETITLLFTAFLGVMAVRFLLHLKTGEDHHAPSALSAWIAAIPIGFGFIMMVVRFAIRIAASYNAWRRGEPAPELKPELH